MPDHSYVTIRSRLSASVQDILTSVTEKLQYSDEQPTREEALILVAVASSGGICPSGRVIVTPLWFELSFLNLETQKLQKIKGQRGKSTAGCSYYYILLPSGQNEVHLGFFWLLHQNEAWEEGSRPT